MHVFNVFSNGIDRNMFDKARKEIFELLSRDSFQRFKKTKLFNNYLDKRRKNELGKRFFLSPDASHNRTPTQFVISGGPSSPSHGHASLGAAPLVPTSPNNANAGSNTAAGSPSGGVS